jgi:hypothetical protein
MMQKAKEKFTLKSRALIKSSDFNKLLDQSCKTKL